ncbi:hypothetical protein AB5J72_07520 [Streptomyces sp. CG1]|uniref:hypothetical protein n=1 Tax=Streptomyces sp. CG1 TaxID=1287523 RepID=UPI0034E25E0F
MAQGLGTALAVALVTPALHLAGSCDIQTGTIAGNLVAGAVAVPVKPEREQLLRTKR